jgi:hypothetical protein
LTLPNWHAFEAKKKDEEACHLVVAYKSELNGWVGSYTENPDRKKYPLMGGGFGTGQNLFEEDDDKTLELAHIIRSNDDAEETLRACIGRMCLSPEDEADSDDEEDDLEVTCQVAQLVRSNDHWHD